MAGHSGTTRGRRTLLGGGLGLLALALGRPGRLVAFRLLLLRARGLLGLLRLVALRFRRLRTRGPRDLLLRLVLRADQLDDGHLRAVAPAGTQAEDPRVPAGTAGE